MARVTKVKEVELHIWEKITGKYHTKDRKVITVGQTFIADKDAFINDSTWKYIGPVDNESI